jgi:cephalosporin-C deacetylase
MPSLDKPLAELHAYRGLNPRPADFDTYWDDSLRELDTHEPKVELIPNHTLPLRQAECFDLWFTGVGGARVHAQYIRPLKRERPAPAVLAFHGYGANPGDWCDRLAYVSEGLCVAALDCRGQGGLSEDNLQVQGMTFQGQIIRGLNDPNPKNLLFRHIFLDTVLLARILMSFPEVDAERIGVFGGSQGGGLTLACAALEPRIRLAAPVFPFLSDYRRVWEMDLCKGAYHELSIFFRRFDPLHVREDHFFTRLGYIDVQHLAPRIRAKTLFAASLQDTVCPPSTQFAAYNKIVAPKELVVYPDFAHEDLPGHRDRTLAFMLQLLGC